tara:strand:- start:301 stop:522 length:222 start_codon:yes stop_codon:yes gene_type:complete
MSKGRPAEKPITTVVVYKKPTGKKHWIFTTEEHIDKVNSSRKHNPLLPNNYQIIEIGVGESFITKYKNQYNIK